MVPFDSTRIRPIRRLNGLRRSHRERVLTWNIGPLAKGASKSVTFQVKIPTTLKPADWHSSSYVSYVHVNDRRVHMAINQVGLIRPHGDIVSLRN